ncbi:MAG: hypothetical protein ACYC7E_14525 [Armatimonadota bacterium]
MTALPLNLYAAWIGFLLGCIAGAVPGLFFHGEDWLGGYNSWTRRMIRLAHISFWGLGFLNLGFVLTAMILGTEDRASLASYLLVFGAVTMPLVCYLSAFRMVFRQLFFIPALSITAAVALVFWSILNP